MKNSGHGDPHFTQYYWNYRIKKDERRMARGPKGEEGGGRVQDFVWEAYKTEVTRKD